MFIVILKSFLFQSFLVLTVFIFFLLRSLNNLESDRPRRSAASWPAAAKKIWPPGAEETWVEVLVVVDGPMIKYHGTGVRHYVLTLMHIVSIDAWLCTLAPLVFKDGSIWFM